MQRITFHNNRNGLEYTFATDTPRALLAAFDGNSLAGKFTQYKPIWYDGIRTKSHTFDGRTITFTAEWWAVENGKRSRERALAEWDKILGVFATGLTGTFTWTNGKETRTIDCYATETPMLTEKARGLFTADFTLNADFPFWQGIEEHSQVLTYTGTGSPSFFTVTNNSPVTVYPLIIAECAVVSGGGYTIARQAVEDALDFDSKADLQSVTISYATGFINGEPIFLDGQKRCAYQIVDDTPINKTNSLSPASSFISLLPGENTMVLAGGGLSTALNVTVKWHDFFLGV